MLGFHFLSSGELSWVRGKINQYFLHRASWLGCGQRAEIFCLAGLEGTLGPCYSRGSPRTSSMAITWHLIKKLSLKPQPRPSETELAFYNLKVICMHINTGEALP